MKLKLFLFAFMILGSLKGFSQATAYPVMDIEQCNNEVFDLTVNTSLALANQSPADFTVTYYESLTDATNATNLITNPSSFVGNQTQEIYVRVTNTTDDSFDTTSFTISWQSVFVYQQDDITACFSYTLPALAVGNYYTAPGGTGTMILPDYVITATQTIYVYDQVDSCSAETAFMVTINSLVANQPTPIEACDDNGDGIVTVDLTTKIPEINIGIPDTQVTFHFSQADAQSGTNPIANPTSFIYEAIAPLVLFVSVSDVTMTCREVVVLVIDNSGCTGNFVSGTVTFDMNNNGCTGGGVPAAYIPVHYTQGNTFITTYTNADGIYVLENIVDGEVEVALQLNASIVAAPASQIITFPGDGADTNFCLSVPNPITDISISLVPITQARPGFAVSYSLVYQNMGSLPASGDISLTFPMSLMTYTASSPAMTLAGNTLTYNYANLMPFETRNITLHFMVMEPPVTVSGTVLNMTTVINPVTGDVNPDNNTNVLDHVVVNSYDPNDIDVREGEFITMAQADDYLHYTVRFQNTGDSAATFVRVETTLDTDLDWTTLQPLSASHEFTTIRNGSALTFKFDDINLAGTQDEPNSHGYVIYRIKPKADAELGDVFSASVNIFFDFNSQVATNVVTTTIAPPMGNKAFTADAFKVYPNPASGQVTVQLANAAAAVVSVTDVLGKTILTTKLQASETNIDVSSLNSGMYFVTVTAGGKSITKKLMVN